MKEGLEAKLEALQSRKDDLLTIGEMGVDQLIVDEAQEFRKLSFATNMTSLKGVDPDGSQRAWDLFVKSRFVDDEEPRPGAAPRLRHADHQHARRDVHRCSASCSRRRSKNGAFTSSTPGPRPSARRATELELQPSGLYKPVTRFSEFVNVAELMAMFRSVADVVLKSDLRHYLRLPSVKGGKRQIVTAEPTRRLQGLSESPRRAHRRHREAQGQAREGRRHSALRHHRRPPRRDRSALRPPGHANEDGNKLNALIANVYSHLARDVGPPLSRGPTACPTSLPGAAQMIFSDLGTLNVEATRGFSAYRWIKSRLVALGVPAERDRLHAGLQEVERQAAPVPGHQRRQDPHPDRLVRHDGHRRQRPAPPDRAPSSRRALAPLADRAARRPHRAPGQRA